MNNFALQYPLWFIIFCVGAGLIYALILYFKDQKLTDQATWKKWLLGLLRFLAIFGISFLLLGPLLKLNQDEIKNPTLILVQDGSSSVNSDQKTKDLLKELKDKFAENYQVDAYHFTDVINEGIVDTLDGGVTNMSQVYSFLDETYANQNIGAVILATDGIINEGQNPVYQKTNLTNPFYFIAQGDTTQKKDILLKQLYHNKIAYLGDKFVVQTDVQAYNFVNTNTNISVYKVNNGNRTLLEKQAIQISNNNFFTTFSFEIPADQVGVVKYVIELDSRNGEFSRKNNSSEFYIDILDARQKILILGNSPHPDIAALKNIITTNKNYEVESASIKDGVKNIADFDLVIFHNLPSAEHGIDNELKVLNSLKRPRIFFAGTQISIATFNQSQNVLSIRANTQSVNEVQGVFNKNFKLFESSDEMKKHISKYPPLKAKFGDFSIDPNSTTLLTQKIGEVETDYPLIAFRNQEGIREVVIAAEGIWQWRLYNYLQEKNFNEINELISKSVQYVTIKEDKRKFRVSSTSNVYKTYDRVGFDAELYNDSYEKVNDVDAFLTIKNTEGKEYNYTFSKVVDFYQIDAGTFPPGNYSYTGTANYNGRQLDATGKFSIQDVQLELANTTADHSLLRNIVAKYGGDLFYDATSETIVQTIKDNANLKPIIYSSTKTESAMNLKWILFLLIGLLFIEWFLRRLMGTY